MYTAAQDKLKLRTKKFALRIMKLYSYLPAATLPQTLGRQVLRSGISVGAHYREAGRARSDAEFISKIEVGLQELEETSYWLELLSDGKIFNPDRLKGIMAETVELIAIFTTIAKRTKQNLHR